MRVLILSCNTGNGHNAAARALAEAFNKSGDETATRDALSPRVSRLICGGHTAIYRRVPALFDLCYRRAEKREDIFSESSPVTRLVTGAAGEVFAELKNYDAVICTHIFAALTVSRLRREGKLTPPAFFVATDYAPCPGLAECRLDGYFTPSPSLTRDYIAAGLEEGDVYPFGIPVSGKFTEVAAEKEKNSVPTILVMMGSLGGGPITEIAERLSEGNAKVKIVTGENERLRKRLAEKYNKNENVTILGYCGDIPRLMDSADILITKPGGLTVTEAASKTLPMALVNPVSGCEGHNLDFFVKRGAAIAANSPRTVCERALALAEDKAALTEMKTALAAIRRPDAAENIAAVTRSFLC